VTIRRTDERGPHRAARASSASGASVAGRRRLRDARPLIDTFSAEPAAPTATTFETP
jgi:hypothetical protein